MNNNVELLGYYGSDITHAQSAWTSTNRELTEDKLNRIDKLLIQLAKDGHHTVFEKSSLHFLVTSDIATHIHFLKHRVGVSLNGECLTGDNIITFVNIKNNSSPKLRITVSDLYHKWNNGRHTQNTEKDKNYSKLRIKNRRIRVLDEKTGFFTYSHIKDVFCKGFQDVYEIILENGKKIKCTNNHKIYTNEGYKTILNGLSVNDFVGINGVSVAGNGLYRNYEEMSILRNSGKSIAEMAEICRCSYHTIRKWLKLHNLQFSEEERNFKKEHKPWNKGVKGYKLNISEIGLENRKKNVKKGKDSHFWRGGISSDRDLIGVWTTNNARKVHEKYNFTCQNCGISSGNLHAHHIIPVTTDISKAYEFDNLITVCSKCHSSIHYSNQTELEFAKKILHEDFIPLKINWGKNKKKRVGNKLQVHFKKITSITYIGKEMTYDIEVEGINNNFIANGIVVHNSARYKELKEDKFYLPQDWKEIEVEDDNIRINDNFSSKYWVKVLENYTNLGNNLYHKCLADLTPVLGRKRAKESARFFKTYNSQITYDVMFNWRSFYHFLNLRNKPEAQLEIRMLAEQMLNLVKNIEGNPFKNTIKAFGY